MIDKHKKQWDFLEKACKADQLAHAYLFEGQENLGKTEFAKKFVEFMGCKFPDLLVVSLGQEKEISIDKIREIQNFLSYKPYYGKFKAVIVQEAEKMNQEAQSCFLKTLEEPRGNAVIILISSKPEMILPTIYSRCQPLKFFGKPIASPEIIAKENEILKSLFSVLGADLGAKFRYAKEMDFEKQDLSLTLKVLQKYFRNLLLLKSGINEKNENNFPLPNAFLSSLTVLKLKEDIKLMQEIHNKIIFTNASPKLALEILLMNI